MSKKLKKEEQPSEDDLEQYLKEMEDLKTDFSDLEELDIEELQEMQDAISKVRDSEKSTNNEKKIVSEQISIPEEEYSEVKNVMLTDFSDLDEIDFEELKEMKQAIETVKQEEAQTVTDKGQETQKSMDISSELEEKIKQELEKKKEIEREEIVTPEKFLEYIKSKRDKIWYHALWYITFKTEDQIASKELLYDEIKYATSKSAIDPIPEHQFYFGLGYLLRLSLNDKKIIRYMSGGKFKINASVKELKELFAQAGDPISKRPILEEEKKKKMFKDFLKEDFLDI